ncbi:MAG: hypothetical protein ACXIU8_00005, partial [Alkalilacustris sp.]
RACAAPQCNWTSSWCGSGQVMACSCDPSNRMDSRCESSTVRVLQQRLFDPGFARRKVAIFDADLTRARRVTLQDWQNRPGATRLTDWAWSWLRPQF